VRSDGRHAITELRRQGRPIAAVVHNRALLRDPGLIEEIMDAARLALENERFEAEMRGQLEHLRASRARIVEAGDAERRRLERDLHDGAQQRLVGLLLVLRMLRAELGSGLASGERQRLDVADSDVRRALSDLRALAHGIFPAALADEGLAAAVETLIDDADAEVDIRELPAGRFPPPVETAAYLLIAETLKRTGATRTAIDASYDGDSLVVELQSDGTAVGGLTDVEDRIGALGGHLQVAWKDGQMRVQAVLPCG
jgi:signal transduction histidine kinase